MNKNTTVNGNVINNVETGATQEGAKGTKTTKATQGTQATETTQGTQATEATKSTKANNNAKKTQEQIVNHDEDVLIDTETSFFGLLEYLRGCPKAVAAEKVEQRYKDDEEREAKLKEMLEKDYGADPEEVYGVDSDEECVIDKDCFKKADRRPGAVQLWNRYHRIAVKEMGNNGRCEVYENGYAVYDNGNRRTVVWVPDCGSTTYSFVGLTDQEKLYMSQKASVEEDVFGPSPWYFAVMIAGENSIERNMMHSKSVGTESVFALDEEGVTPDYSWCSYGHIETPEEAFERKEEHEEMLGLLSEEQKQIFILYFDMGYTQEQIAGLLGKDRSTVKTHIARARAKIRKWKKENAD